jgi:bifunctional oligoribonuclease and PAP phosphatase NrnA
MLDIASLTELLAQPKKIVITTHHKPDGDAMGSSLGLYNYLIQQGHHAKVIAPTDYPQNLSWLPCNDDVIIYTETLQQSVQLIADADIIFCLDFNALSRINEMGVKVGESKAKKVMIDHHLEPADFDDIAIGTSTLVQPHS